jgi:2'-5' RNA ligase
MEQIRSFIAIELPEELKLKLGQLEAQLKSNRQPWVKWVDPRGIHLTLKFLGNISVDTIEAVTAAIAETAQGTSPFHLGIKDVSAFPSLKRVQVVWVGMNGELSRLSEFQLQLEIKLERLGFTPESRPFTPHLTIARLRNDASPADREVFGRLIAETKFEGGQIEADTISLMRSQLTREGAIYTRISAVKLGS